MMKKLFTQLRNEWRGNFFLALELLVVFVVLMIVVGVCYPARRAMQVQPAEALHDE